MNLKNKTLIILSIIIILNCFIMVKANSVQYIYDDLGRVKTASFQNSLQTIEYFYDANGNVTNTKNSSMIKEIYNYPIQIVLELNKSLSLNVDAILVDGNSKNITNLCLFNADNKNIVKIENNNITALNKGRTELTISVHNIYKKIPVLVTEKQIDGGNSSSSGSNSNISNGSSNNSSSSNTSNSSNINSGNNSSNLSSDINSNSSNANNSNQISSENEDNLNSGYQNNNLDSTTTEINWNKLLSQIERSDNGGTIRLNIKDKTLIDRKIFNLIKQKNITLILDYGYYEWRFIGKDIDLNLIKEEKYDLTVSFISPNKDKIDKLIENENIINLYINYHGKLPAISSLDIKLDNMYSEKELNLYYYDRGQNQLQYYGEIKTDNYCWVRIALNHCSDYILSYETIKGAIDVSGQVTKPNYLGAVSDFFEKPYTDIEANINAAANETIIHSEDYIQSNSTFVLWIIFIILFIILLARIKIFIVVKKKK